MGKFKSIHAGDILRLNFLNEMHMTNENLAGAIGVDPDVVHQLVNGRTNAVASLPARPKSK
ncbi:hypothetical protein BH09BAC3_BH09BAC3_35890 [soil metagenome]